MVDAINPNKLQMNVFIVVANYTYILNLIEWSKMNDFTPYMSK